MTPSEYNDELTLARMFCRPPRQYIKDFPFYPYVPQNPRNPKQMVNFDLNFTE